MEGEKKEKRHNYGKKLKTRRFEESKLGVKRSQV